MDLPCSATRSCLVREGVQSVLHLCNSKNSKSVEHRLHKPETTQYCGLRSVCVVEVCGTLVPLCTLTVTNVPQTSNMYISPRFVEHLLHCPRQGSTYTTKYLKVTCYFEKVQVARNGSNSYKSCEASRVTDSRVAHHARVHVDTMCL